MTPQELLRIERPDVDATTHVLIGARIQKRFGAAVALKKIGRDAESKAGPNVPAIWILAFVGSKIVVHVRIGTQRHLLGEFDVAAVPDGARRAEILGRLRDEGVLNAKEVAAFVRAHPDRSRLAELRERMAAKLRALEALKDDLKKLQGELAAAGG